MTGVGRRFGQWGDRYRNPKGEAFGIYVPVQEEADLEYNEEAIEKWRGQDEQSIVPPGFFGADPEKNILCVRDFVEKEDLKTMQAFFPTIDDWADPGETQYNDAGDVIYDPEYWRDRQVDHGAIARVAPEIHSIVDKYIAKGAKTIEEHWGVEVWSRPPSLICWRKGQNQLPHADKQLNNGWANAFVTYDLSSLIYWNEAFEGGQLYYPQHDIEVEIEEGTFAAHVGDVHFLHGVREITSGERWTTPAFYGVTDVKDRVPILEPDVLTKNEAGLTRVPEML
tara:strand:+ start:972 stop:1814 length:843 start_codon:yes stop_codon:yes gene_type:complete